MGNFIYKGEKTKEISFPLGGIGTGCIGLAGNGSLIDWEIFNKPNKGSINGFSHFAVKAETAGKVLDARVLSGDLQPPYTGSLGKPHFNTYGFGPDRGTMAGVPHFRDVEFIGEYPIAKLRFRDDNFPGNVTMTAFNPFIPLNDKDSSIPGAFFEIEVENNSNETISYTICLSVTNPFYDGTAVNTYSSEGDFHYVRLASNKYDSDEPEYGDITVAAQSDNASCQEYWYRGSWFDSLEVFWRQFSEPGRLVKRSYSSAQDLSGNVYSGSDTASLASHIEIAPGQTECLRFIIAWNYPNCHNYWNPEKCSCNDGCCDTDKPGTWKNYYAALFEDSGASASYALKNWDRLYRDTLEFKEALFESTIPAAALEAVSANISILKTPTGLRLEDGSFYGWEGCHPDSGCCEGSCTHVWNYAYALPFLFPKLERSMRDLDFKHNQGADGGMSFRLQLPLGRERSAFRPCADGQFGGVIKAYRDWKISGDSKWLKSNWPAVKNSIEFAWAETNEDKWDPHKKGVLEGRQHHTLDMELFGPNSWLTGFYLAALKAGAEMAERLGEADKAQEYREIFERGKQWADENLFNGEYYHQLIDLKDKSIVDSFNAENYWNNEAGEIKYQIGEGCIIDQVLAQWHANLCGLGEIFDKEQTRSALAALYKYNFKKSMRNFFNPCRIYSLNDEAGIVICEWPEGKYKPVIPITYASETMNGFEYQAAIHMIQEGMVDEGMQIVKAVRERYDGEKRNPWNEFECGSNYARSMASYALLNTFSGFEYDMVEGMIGFNPIETGDDDFKCFWSLDPAWGLVKISPSSVELKVIYGKLDIRAIRLPFLEGEYISGIALGDNSLQFERDGEQIVFDNFVTITKNCPLILTC